MKFKTRWLVFNWSSNDLAMISIEEEEDKDNGKFALQVSMEGLRNEWMISYIEELHEGKIKEYLVISICGMAFTVFASEGIDSFFNELQKFLGDSLLIKEDIGDEV